MFHYMFTAESDGERNLIINQHLVKLWAIKYRFVFYETRCIHNTRSIPRVQASIKPGQVSIHSSSIVYKVLCCISVSYRLFGCDLPL